MPNNFHKPSRFERKFIPNKQNMRINPTKKFTYKLVIILVFQIEYT